MPSDLTPRNRLLAALAPDDLGRFAPHLDLVELAHGAVLHEPPGEVDHVWFPEGAVVYACDPDTTAADWLFKRGLPLVTVDQEPVPGVPSVIVDDRGGGRQAAAHVIELGHRRIGIIAFGNGPEGLVPDPTPDAAAGRYIARERLTGYLDVFGPAGVRPVLHTQHRNDDGCGGA